MAVRPIAVRNYPYVVAFCAAMTITQWPITAQVSFLRRDLAVPGTFGGFELRIPTAQVTTGDFNGDGRPDLVLGGLSGTAVLLNLGGGQFGPPIINSYKPCGPMIAGDFDRDGKLDLLATAPCQFSGAFLAGRGDGTFKPPIDVPGMGIGAAGDLNHDGKLDLVVNDGNTGSLNALLGNGDGTFRPAIRLGSGPGNRGQIVVADFNHDGLADVATGGGAAVMVYLGRGDGTFEIPAALPVDPLQRILVADVNGDGFPDVIAGFEILAGKGDGTFAEPYRYSTAAQTGIDFPVPLAAADFDGDGRADLALGSGNHFDSVGNQILIFRGRADGTLSDPAVLTVGWQPYIGAAADLDGDGRPDLVIGNLTSNTLSLLLNKNGSDTNRVQAVSSAGGTALVAPGSLAALYTSTGAAGNAQAGPPPWPTRLGGIGLEIRDSGGAAVLAPLLYVSATQINFYVPDGVALGEATLAIVSDSGSAPSGSMQVAAVAPGLLMVSEHSVIPAAFEVMVHPDGTQTVEPLFQCSSANSCSAVPARWNDPARFLILYGTGFRNASTANVTYSLNGFRSTVDYAGPQGTPGLDQINIALPNGFWEEFVSDGNPSFELVLSVGGVFTNRVLISLAPISRE